LLKKFNQTSSPTAHDAVDMYLVYCISIVLLVEYFV